MKNISFKGNFKYKEAVCFTRYSLYNILNTEVQKQNEPK